MVYVIKAIFNHISVNMKNTKDMKILKIAKEKEKNKRQTYISHLGIK